jgi:hypothetical protein
MTGIIVIAKAAGFVLAGAGMVAYAFGWLMWHWFTGAPWFPPVRRRYVTRPVRATFQTLATLAALGFVVRPVVTGWVLASLVTSLAVAASAWRLREYLDNRTFIKIGKPVRVLVPPVDVEIVEELPTAARRRMATTRQMLRELEAAR